jgi:transaldolase
MTCATPTDLWIDSWSIEELSSSITQNGAVGATANPVIVLGVVKKGLSLWKDRFPQIIQEMKGATEDDVAWRIVEEMSVNAAMLLQPVFVRENGRNGRFSVRAERRVGRTSVAWGRASVRTPRQFCNATENLAALMRDYMLADLE